jgi:hypothetical protein
MKIGEIRITNYHQFKDFALDLTYPTGHPKEGQPLEKVSLSDKAVGEN